jgi:hypothetical protein
MRFAPEYIACVLNENFEDAKQLFLSPLVAIDYAHLVMLADRGIVSATDARAIRDALDSISQDEVRDLKYDGTYEDLFFYLERLIVQKCGEDAAGRLHTASSRNDIDMTMSACGSENLSSVSSAPRSTSGGRFWMSPIVIGRRSSRSTRTRRERSRRQWRTTCSRSSNSSSGMRSG